MKPGKKKMSQISQNQKSQINLANCQSCEKNFVVAFEVNDIFFIRT